MSEVDKNIDFDIKIASVTVRFRFLICSSVYNLDISRIRFNLI